LLYLGTVPCDVEKITVQPKAPDSKCVIVVSGSEPDFVKPLLMGETKIVVKVSSVDGTNTKVLHQQICVSSASQINWFSVSNNISLISLCTGL